MDGVMPATADAAAASGRRTAQETPALHSGAQVQRHKETALGFKQIAGNDAGEERERDDAPLAGDDRDPGYHVSSAGIEGSNPLSAEQRNRMPWAENPAGARCIEGWERPGVSGSRGGTPR